MTGGQRSGLAQRVAELIARRDRGSSRIAAQRLGIPHEALQALLDVETHADRSTALDPATIAALVRGYQVDACWLLTGEHDLSRFRAEHDEWIRTTDLLFEIGRRAAARRRA